MIIISPEPLSDQNQQKILNSFTELNDDQTLLAKHNGILIMAEDIRQHAYCKRIIYFRHVMNIWPIKTFKMERGENIHEKKARSKTISKDGAIERYHNIWLQSIRLGIGGLLDAFEFTGNDLYPVEIKTGQAPEDRGVVEIDYHKVQVVAQSMLLEEAFNFPVSHARVLYTDACKDYFINITIDDKRALLRRIREIQDIIKLEILPPASAQKGKCVDCEFWQYCLGT